MTASALPWPNVPRLTAKLIPLALRSAWHARALWHRVARPLTMGVRTIILDGPDGPDLGQRRVLLIRHSYVGGWHFPGGGVGKGETLLSAARREAREEVGLDLDCDPQPFGVYARFRHGASDHVAVFVATGWSGTPKADGVEIVEARFFPLDRLPTDISPATLRRLEEFKGNKPRAEAW